MEVEPLALILFPKGLELSEWRDQPPAPTILTTYVYRRASPDRLRAIRSSDPTPTYIKVQLSKAELLYEYEGESRG